MAYNDFLPIEDNQSNKTAPKGIIWKAIITIVFGIIFYFSILSLRFYWLIFLFRWSPVIILFLTFGLFIVKNKLWKEPEKCDKVLNGFYIAILFFSTLSVLFLFFLFHYYY
jgi:hypothetical protein